LAALRVHSIFFIAFYSFLLLFVNWSPLDIPTALCLSNGIREIGLDFLFVYPLHGINELAFERVNVIDILNGEFFATFCTEDYNICVFAYVRVFLIPFSKVMEGTSALPR
jgi:hypothetical protein